MVRPETRLRVNVSEVTGQVIDGEAIIMNLTTGMFYSTDGAGGFAWEALSRGLCVGEVADAVAARFDVSVENARNDVVRLAEQLLEEGLAHPDGAQRPGSTAGPPPTGERLPYSAPVLSRYSDMVDLLALDPPLPVLGAQPWSEPEAGR